MRTIAVVTTSRADYGACRPVLRALQSDPELTLLLFVSGMHLCPEHGLTVREIEADGFEITQRIEVLFQSDKPEWIAKSMARGIAGFSEVFSRRRPDILVIVGDRFEMFSAAVASVPFNIPIAHLGGGDVTVGTMDEALRHALTKLSHLHFASTAEYARRIIQMGEEPWRVCVSGEPNLDAFLSMRLLAREELEARYSVRLQNRFLLVTYHPVTLQHEQSEWQIDQLLTALQMCAMPILFTMPNADSGNKLIRERIRQFVAANAFAGAVENFGVEAYVSVMALAAAMVGNSSSGILEAASFKLPVVNIGIRQAGRLRSKNVIDVGNTTDEIVSGIQKALERGFLASLEGLVNPYGTGCAVPRILEVVKKVAVDAKLLQKRFYDLSASQCAVPAGSL